MSDGLEPIMGDDGNPYPLPPRDPRPYYQHFLIDGFIAFALVFVIGIILGAPWQLLAIIGIVAGLLGAPITQRIEARQLEERRLRHHAADATFEARVREPLEDHSNDE